MNEQIIIPYLGSFLSLFLVGIMSFLQTRWSKTIFSYILIVLSALNIYLCGYFDANQIFIILNIGLIVLGAGSLFDE